MQIAKGTLRKLLACSASSCRYIIIIAALGAKVIATAGTAEKLQVAKEHGGADYTIDYTKPNWQDEVKKITKGKGVDVIYDPVGMILPSLKCIAWNGRAIVVGFAAGSIEKVPMNLVLLKNISIVRDHRLTRRHRLMH